MVGMLVLGGFFLARHHFRSEQYRAIDFTTLGGFKIDGVHGRLPDVPHPIRQLDGQRIEIDGMMIPLDQAEKFTSFAIVPRLFGKTAFWVPPIQETIVARMVDGRFVAYTPERIRVRGVLHIRITYDEGYLVCIYEIDAESVAPAPQLTE